MTSYTYIGEDPIRVPILDWQPKVVVQPWEKFESSYKLSSEYFKTDEQLENSKKEKVETASKPKKEKVETAEWK